MDLAEVAYDLLMEGFNPLPIKADKHPKLPQGHPYLYERIPDDKVHSLFSNVPKLGIACGDVSGGFMAMDFDAHKNQPITDIFNQYTSDEAVKSIITRYNLPLFKTPSGGYHIYFKSPYKKSKGRKYAAWEDGECMIEVRGHGQYIIVYPSPGYTQISGCSINEVPCLTEYEVDCLVDTAATFSQFIKAKDTPVRTTKGSWPDKFDTTTLHGRYNETEVDEAKRILTEAGWSYVKTTNRGIEYWLRPDKDQTGTDMSATFGTRHNMFYVFSDAADGFLENTAYTPFDIFMTLRHSGDFKAATDELRRRYTPQAPPPEPPVSSTASSFPIDIFPEDLRGFITDLNKALGFSKDFLSVSILFAFATLVGNKYRVRIKAGWETPPLFWFAIVGNPGTMKSHPVATILKPIKEIDRKSKLDYDKKMNEYHLAQIEKKTDKTITLPERPRFRQILISDITLEALHDVHSFNKRGLGYYRDELYGFVNGMNMYRDGADAQFWLESFNNSSYIVNRATKEPVMVEDAMINIIGTIQPKVLMGMAKMFANDGFIDRFLFTSAETRIPDIDKTELHPELLAWWDGILQRANNQFKYATTKDTEIIHLEDDATDLFFSIRNSITRMQQDEATNPSIVQYLGKMITYLPRFMLLLSIVDNFFHSSPLVVTTDHVKRSHTIINYFLASASDIFTSAEQKTEIEHVDVVLRGKTMNERILMLAEKGFKQARIADQVGVTRQRVSHVLKEAKFKKPS